MHAIGMSMLLHIFIGNPSLVLENYQPTVEVVPVSAVVDCGDTTSDDEGTSDTSDDEGDEDSNDEDSNNEDSDSGESSDDADDANDAPDEFVE